MPGYKKIFDLIIFHTFFNNNRCKCLSIVPTENTKSFLHKADLVLNTTKTGISVSYNTDFTHSLLAYLEDDISLFFHLRSNDHLFYNYTELGHENGKLLYYNSGANHENEGMYCLSNGEYVDSSEEKPVNDPVFNTVLNKEEKISAPVGVIQINLSDLFPDKVIEDLTSPKHYYIKFKSRETYWLYNIIQNNDNGYDELAILDKNLAITFSKAKKVALSNGILAYQVISNQPVSLQEFSDYHFYLKGMKDGQEKILINKLNVAGIKQINKKEEKKISEIYVYY